MKPMNREVRVTVDHSPQSHCVCAPLYQPTLRRTVTLRSPASTSSSLESSPLTVKYRSSPEVSSDAPSRVFPPWFPPGVFTAFTTRQELRQWTESTRSSAGLNTWGAAAWERPVWVRHRCRDDGAPCIVQSALLRGGELLAPFVVGLAQRLVADVMEYL